MKPYRLKSMQVLNSVNEVLIILLHLAVCSFVISDLDDQASTVGSVSILVILTVILVNVVMSLTKSIQSICKLFKRRVAEPVESVIPQNITTDDQLASSTLRVRSKSVEINRY